MTRFKRDRGWCRGHGRRLAALLGVFIVTVSVTYPVRRFQATGGGLF